MNDFALSIRKELYDLADEKYKNFSSSLIPNKNNLIGVRIPILRKLANRIIKEDYSSYLNFAPDFLEEELLQAIISAKVKTNLKEKLKLVKEFIPKIDNWSVCDTFCNSLKIKEENKKEFWNFLKKYFKSNKEFEIRFSHVILLNYYINDEYIDNILKILESFNSQKYYAQMGCAWLISMCYVKFPIKTKEFLLKKFNDEVTKKIAIKKISESLQVSKKQFKNDFYNLK